MTILADFPHNFAPKSQILPKFNDFDGFPGFPKQNASVWPMQFEKSTKIIKNYNSSGFGYGRSTPPPPLPRT